MFRKNRFSEFEVKKDFVFCTDCGETKEGGSSK